MHYRPFKNQMLNRVELFNILSLTITMYAGMFYAAGIGEAMDLLLTSVIIVFTCCFMIFWVYVYINTMIQGSRVQSMLGRMLPLSLTMAMTMESDFKDVSTQTGLDIAKSFQSASMSKFGTIHQSLRDTMMNEDEVFVSDRVITTITDPNNE